MSTTAPDVYTRGTIVQLEADLTSAAGVGQDASGITWLVRDPAGHEEDRTADVVHDGTGRYHLDVLADALGNWYWRVVTTGLVVAAEGSFSVITEYDVVDDPTAPVDLRVLVPRARRYCEGPFPSEDRRLTDQQLYEMVADACGDIILLSGGLFNRKLLVTQRDPRTGFPMGWRTDQVLQEWESSFIAIQTALNYFFHEFKDKKVSENIANEGQTWEYALSPNLLRQQFDMLVKERDAALEVLLEWYPIVARFASVVAVRDRVTATQLEWWVNESPGAVGAVGGIGGGQEAAVIPAFFP